MSEHSINEKIASIDQTLKEICISVQKISNSLDNIEKKFTLAMPPPVSK